MTGSSPAPTAAARRRKPARTFLPLAVAAWLILEIWLLGLVADAAGGLAVAALVAGGIVLGAVVVKRAGRRAFRNLADTFQQAQASPEAHAAQPPAGRRPGSGNALTMLAGLLFMLPGLVSDAAALLLLLPPVRAWVGRRTARSLERRMNAAQAGTFADAFQQARIHHPDGKVVQGEVIREDAPQEPGPGHRPPLTP
ncbi:FxsA family membrane protein [Streptomyces toxytricini]|uniref:FxsA family membrane protein n=1 Tax=Streptomyces toxytricini TaxID=67369 RepID=A0ABW8EQY3_STRT5